MATSDMTITVDDMMAAHARIIQLGFEETTRRLAEAEPALLAYILGSTVAGDYRRAAMVALVCVDAMQMATQKLWSDLLPEEPKEGDHRG